MNQPRDPQGAAHAAEILMRHEGREVAVERIQDELNSVSERFSGDDYEQEQQSLLAALSVVRRQGEGP